MMPISSWQSALWWLLTAVVIGFGWHVGNWLGSKLTK